MVEVTPGLLLGSMGDVVALLGRARHRSRGGGGMVTRLLSIISTPIDWSEIKTPQGSLMAKHISLPDLPSSDLLTHFPECVQFITDCTQDGGTVLVHWLVNKLLLTAVELINCMMSGRALLMTHL